MGLLSLSLASLVGQVGEPSRSSEPAAAKTARAAPTPLLRLCPTPLQRLAAPAPLSLGAAPSNGTAQAAAGEQRAAALAAAKGAEEGWFDSHLHPSLEGALEGADVGRLLCHFELMSGGPSLSSAELTLAAPLRFHLGAASTDRIMRCLEETSGRSGQGLARGTQPVAPPGLEDEEEKQELEVGDTQRAASSATALSVRAHAVEIELCDGDDATPTALALSLSGLRAERETAQSESGARAEWSVGIAKLQSRVLAENATYALMMPLDDRHGEVAAGSALEAAEPATDGPSRLESRLCYAAGSAAQPQSVRLDLAPSLWLWSPVTLAAAARVDEAWDAVGAHRAHRGSGERGAFDSELRLSMPPTQAWLLPAAPQHALPLDSPPEEAGGGAARAEPPHGLCVRLSATATAGPSVAPRAAAAAAAAGSAGSAAGVWGASLLVDVLGATPVAFSARGVAAVEAVERSIISPARLEGYALVGCAQASAAGEATMDEAAPAPSLHLRAGLSTAVGLHLSLCRSQLAELADLTDALEEAAEEAFAAAAEHRRQGGGRPDAPPRRGWLAANHLSSASMSVRLGGPIEATLLADGSRGLLPAPVGRARLGGGRLLSAEHVGGSTAHSKAELETSIEAAVWSRSRREWLPLLSRATISAQAAHVRGGIWRGFCSVSALELRLHDESLRSLLEVQAGGANGGGDKLDDEAEAPRRPRVATRIQNQSGKELRVRCVGEESAHRILAGGARLVFLDEMEGRSGEPRADALMPSRGALPEPPALAELAIEASAAWHSLPTPPAARLGKWTFITQGPASGGDGGSEPSAAVLEPLAVQCSVRALGEAECAPTLEGAQPLQGLSVVVRSLFTVRNATTSAMDLQLSIAADALAGAAAGGRREGGERVVPFGTLPPGGTCPIPPDLASVGRLLVRPVELSDSGEAAATAGGVAAGGGDGGFCWPAASSALYLGSCNQTRREAEQLATLKAAFGLPAHEQHLGSWSCALWEAANALGGGKVRGRLHLTSSALCFVGAREGAARRCLRVAQLAELEKSSVPGNLRAGRAITARAGATEPPLVLCGFRSRNRTLAALQLQLAPRLPRLAAAWRTPSSERLASHFGLTEDEVTFPVPSLYLPCTFPVLSLMARLASHFGLTEDEVTFPVPSLYLPCTFPLSPP